MTAIETVRAIMVCRVLNEPGKVMHKNKKIATDVISGSSEEVSV